MIIFLHSGDLRDVFQVKRQQDVELSEFDIVIGRSPTVLRQANVRFTDSLILLRPANGRAVVAFLYTALTVFFFSPASGHVYLSFHHDRVPELLWKHVTRAHFNPRDTVDTVKSSIQLSFTRKSYKTAITKLIESNSTLHALVKRVERLQLKEDRFLRAVPSEEHDDNDNNDDDNDEQRNLLSQPQRSPSPRLRALLPPSPPKARRPTATVPRRAVPIGPTVAMRPKTPIAVRTFVHGRKAPIDLAADDDSDESGAGNGADDASGDAMPLFVYPPPPNDRGSVTLTSYDLERLKPGEFLNDTLIEFYMKHLMIDVLTPEQRARCYVFNTFFFDKIAAGRPDNGKYYADVARWTKDVDLFAKDFVFIPINENAHWRLIVVCFAGELLNGPMPTEGASPEFSSQASQASQAGESGRGATLLARTPCVLSFDSLGGVGGAAFRIIRDYFMRELLDKRPGAMLAAEAQARFASEQFVAATVTVPEQDNVSDCGLFVLQYAELLMTRADELFSSETAPRATRAQLSKLLTRHGKSMWFEQKLITRKRKQLRTLIERIARETAKRAELAASVQTDENEFVDVVS
jgi:hypothetical protein